MQWARWAEVSRLGARDPDGPRVDGGPRAPPAAAAAARVRAWIWSITGVCAMKATVADFGEVDHAVRAKLITEFGGS